MQFYNLTFIVSGDLLRWNMVKPDGLCASADRWLHDAPKEPKERADYIAKYLAGIIGAKLLETND